MEYLAIILGLNLLQFFAIIYLIGHMACMIYGNEQRIKELEKNK